MKDPRIEAFEKSQLKEKVADVRVGDTVVIHKIIVEGKKKRTQLFKGTVIKMQGSLSRLSVTVRKIVEGVGVEKTYLVHSPLVPKIEIVKRAKVRRAKLYYLRNRVGARANRLKVKELETQVEVAKEAPVEDVQEPVKAEEAVVKQEEKQEKKEEKKEEKTKEKNEEKAEEKKEEAVKSDA